METLLSKHLEKGQAIIWYLGRTGWAIKTQNNLFLKPWEWGERDPVNPSLANGNIVSEEMINQNVIFFGNAKEVESLVPPNVFLRTKSSEFNITLISDKTSKSNHINTVSLEPMEHQVIGSAELIRDKNNNILIMADGVKIFLEAWREGDEKIKQLAQGADLLFLNNEYLEEAEAKVKSYAPKVLFHHSTYTCWPDHLNLSNGLKKSGHQLELPVNKFPGDCFIYKKGKITSI